VLKNKKGVSQIDASAREIDSLVNGICYLQNQNGEVKANQILQNRPVLGRKTALLPHF
jgi:hypothetical protein